MYLQGAWKNNNNCFLKYFLVKNILKYYFFKKIFLTKKTSKQFKNIKKN
jgi:hypothetical protein